METNVVNEVMIVKICKRYERRRQKELSKQDDK